VNYRIVISARAKIKIERIRSARSLACKVHDHSVNRTPSLSLSLSLSKKAKAPRSSPDYDRVSLCAGYNFSITSNRSAPDYATCTARGDRVIESSDHENTHVKLTKYHDRRYPTDLDHVLTQHLFPGQLTNAKSGRGGLATRSRRHSQSISRIEVHPRTPRCSRYRNVWRESKREQPTRPVTAIVCHINRRRVAFYVLATTTTTTWHKTREDLA